MLQANLINIIIADDHELIRYGMINLLKTRENVRIVAESATGEELVALVAEHQPDVVLTDIQMPGMGGIAATRIITSSYPATSVIALSMFHDKDSILQMLNAGAMGYLLKGGNKKELLTAIDTVHFNGNHYLGDLGPGLGTFSLGKYLNGEEKEETLTDRELEIVNLICKEYSSKQMAGLLNISIRTVGGHRESILKKTSSQNTVGIILYALRNKLYIP